MAAVRVTTDGLNVLEEDVMAGVSATQSSSVEAQLFGLELLTKMLEADTGRPKPQLG